MKQFLARKRILALSGLAAIAIAAVAVAYFTTSGSGSGSGTVNASAPAITLSGDVTFDVLGETKPVTISAENLGTSPGHIASVSVDSITEAGTCPDGSFTTDTPVVTDNEVAAGATEPVATVNITFENLTGAAQNDCIGANAVSFAYSSN